MPNGKMLFLAERLQAGKRSRLVGKYTDRQKKSFDGVVAEARELEDNQLPRRKRGNGRGRMPDLPERLEPLKVERDRIASGLGLEPSLLGSRAVLEDIVLDPSCAKDRLIPWQFELLADAIGSLPRPDGGGGE